MSYRSTRSSAMSQTKDLPIPDHVPVGAVIGKGGSYCKALRDNHGVHCSVNGEDRQVTLTGPRPSLQEAEDELVKLFASFAVEKKRVFEVVARGGRSRWLSFEREKNVSSNSEVEDYPYRLQQSGRAVETASVNKGVFRKFAVFIQWIRQSAGSWSSTVSLHPPERFAEHQNAIRYLLKFTLILSFQDVYK
ncbi:hypothetical protein PR001_g5365, partial [Phytophthora rubi]